MTTKTKPLALSTLACAVTVAMSGQVAAQSAGGRVLEETLVTAQKREQSLQEVPAAVSAFGGATIEEAGWRDIAGLQEAVPALEIGGENKVRPYVSIRGIGTRKFDVGTDGSIGLFVDEIYNARFSSVLNGIMDVERVEVLKGPQGTLYGRNTIGGAINIITRRPGEEMEGRIKVAAGNDGFYEVGGSISGPIVEDALAGRLSLATRDIDGVFEDTVSGKDTNDENKIARVSLLGTPNDEWDLTLIGDYSNIESDASLSDHVPGDVYGVLLVSPADPRVPGVVEASQRDRYSNAYSRPGFIDQETLQLSFKAKYSGDSFDFLSITSYNDEEYDETRDFDTTELDPWSQVIEQASDQLSQEFRLSSVAGGAGTFDDRLTWVAGIYYFTDDAERYDAFPATPDSILYFPPPGGGDDVTAFNVAVETDSYAVYGQATYALTDDLNLTLGLRYTEDKKDFEYEAFSQSPLPPIPMPFKVGDELEFDSLDPKVTVDYHVSEDVMVYATYSTGYKSGGVQYAVGEPQVALDSFDEEELTNYEVGLKSRMWDQRLQFNATAFYYDFTDQQVQSIILVNDAPAALTQNAAQSEMTGVEVELQVLPTDALTLDLRYAYLDAEFDEFDSVGNDFSGNTMPAAPEHAYTASVTHVTEFSDWGTLSLNARYAWRDDQYFNFANSEVAFQEGYGLLNLAAWWDLPDGSTRIRAFCDNCDDEEYLITFTAFPDPFGGGFRNWGRGRHYGVEVSYDF
ncbi:MAG: TonB-dependent receptor [Halioglobus sp.]|nr:TonB-dependent receptor [Halioglobus sp.]